MHVLCSLMVNYIPDQADFGEGWREIEENIGQLRKEKSRRSMVYIHCKEEEVQSLSLWYGDADSAVCKINQLPEWSATESFCFLLLIIIYDHILLYFKKAFDSVQHHKHRLTMLEMNPVHLVNLLAKLYGELFAILVCSLCLFPKRFLPLLSSSVDAWRPSFLPVLAPMWVESAGDLSGAI